MIQFHIEAPDKGLETTLQDEIGNLTEPKGSLGTLEALALQVGLVQQTLSPVLHHPVNIIYASDHGIADESVSKSPKEVTCQVIHNFLNGGAGVCHLTRRHGFKSKVADGGVDFDFPVIPQLIDRKMRKEGTHNFLHEATMTVGEMEKALQYGADIVTDCYNEGCNVVSFGGMGIESTAASSMWMTCFTQIPLADCVGAGNGLDSEGIRHKYNALKRSLRNYKGDGSALDVMRCFGGYEMVMVAEGMLRAAELKMIIPVDGFIMTNCVLATSRLYPEIQSYCTFGYCGSEAGHKRVLDLLGAKALFDLRLRLGEGSGSAYAYPILDSAVRMINEMHSFKQAAITKYFRYIADTRCVYILYSVTVLTVGGGSGGLLQEYREPLGVGQLADGWFIDIDIVRCLLDSSAIRSDLMRHDCPITDN